MRDIGMALARGEPAPPAALARLKDAARRALAGAALELDPAGGYRWDFSRAPAASAVLGPIAWSAVDLLARGPLTRLKRCPGPGCGWLFLDRSKNGSRRWCDMATCGNRTKGRRHRARRG
jgi:predicted RNA-binding Zn ribbon-like protein